MSRSMLDAATATKMYIDKFKKEVLIERDHPLAVAQIAKNARKGRAAVVEVEDEVEDEVDDEELEDEGDDESSDEAPTTRVARPKKKSRRPR